MAASVPYREVSEAENRDREAEQEIGEDQRGSRGHSQPRQKQEEEN